MQREDPEETYGLHSSLDADDQLHFRVVLTRVDGPLAIGPQLGWDGPTKLWKPYLSLEVFGWMLLIGWTYSFESPYARHAGQVCERAVRRDVWGLFPDHEGGITRELVEVCRLHHPEIDDNRPFMLQNMLQDAGIKDGDQFEILITPTDIRPFGDRHWVRDATLGVRPETDQECEERIETCQSTA